MDDIWFGSREFLSTNVLDSATQPPTAVQNYHLALIPIGARVQEAVWVAATTYAGERGIWADGLAAGSYRVMARVGSGAPNELTIVQLGIVNVRSK